MGKRLGMARMEALLENLKREIALGAGTTLKGRRDATETLSTVGTYASPTKTLEATDSGMTFFVDMSTVNIVVQLPTPAAGLNFKIIMATASDNEATKDFALTTGSNSVDIGGHIRQGGNSVIEITSNTSVVAFDSNDGAVTVGDYLDIYCDGTDWYCIGTTVTAATIDIADTYNGHSLP
tara:strand:+ start:263 stop:802 length:540 start_codon:yes stop_codon:yes gene_type:complete